MYAFIIKQSFKQHSCLLTGIKTIIIKHAVVDKLYSTFNLIESTLSITCHICDVNDHF